MNLTGQETDDIRDALFSKVEALKGHLETLEGAIEDLEGGKTVYPFANGPSGVRTARDMHADMLARRDRLRALAERFFNEDASA